MTAFLAQSTPCLVSSLVMYASCAESSSTKTWITTIAIPACNLLDPLQIPSVMQDIKRVPGKPAVESRVPPPSYSTKSSVKIQFEPRTVIHSLVGAEAWPGKDRKASFDVVVIVIVTFSPIHFSRKNDDRVKIMPRTRHGRQSLCK